MNSKKVLLGVLAGIAAGALLGVLFAPEKGTETRKNISRKSDDIVDSLSDKFNEFVDSISEKFEKVKEEVSDFTAHVNSKAEEAKNLVKANWEIQPSKADNETIFKHILKTATESRVRHKGGELETGKKESEILFESEYLDGYKAHASIETHAATALYEKEELTIWASSQTPFGTRQELADLLKLPKEKIHVKQIFLGGGFGGKIYNRQATEAARIAKMVEGTPVQISWTRQEEFMYDMFRSAAVVKINSGITKGGTIKYWDFNTYCAGDR